MLPLRTYVYIDGFNFYYGQVKASPYKWINLDTLLRHYLDPAINSIQYIKYFTAKIKPRSKDPDQLNRQLIYLRALETIPNFEIIYGHFLTHEVLMPRADGKGMVKVIKTEEKKSDVNIATHIIHDAYRDKYDLAVLVSNDSDFSEPLRIITQEMDKKVGLLNPQKHKVSKELSKFAIFIKQLRSGALSISQFPQQLTDIHGTFHKPKEW